MKLIIATSRETAEWVPGAIVPELAWVIQN